MSVHQGDVHWCDLDPTVGHEVRKRRPVLILSPDRFNAGAGSFQGLVVAVPLTSTNRGWVSHVEIAMPGRSSWAMVEQLRAVSHRRVLNRVGTAAPDELAAVQRTVRILLDL